MSMKKGISNIAWNDPWNSNILKLLKEEGLDFIEIAPTKIWPTWKYNTSNLLEFRKFVNDHGLYIGAMQSTLFNTKDLMLFNGDLNRSRLLNHLIEVDEMCSILGISKIVFGSPKNRIIPSNMTYNEAFDISLDFFNELSRKTSNTTCIEANAEQYNCNFMYNSTQSSELVNTLDLNNIKLHIDTACMTLAEEDPERISELSFDHFHISEPYLNKFDDIVCDHEKFSNSLNRIKYKNGISIEMRNVENEKDNINRIKEAIRVTKNIYF